VSRTISCGLTPDYYPGSQTLLSRCLSDQKTSNLTDPDPPITSPILDSSNSPSSFPPRDGHSGPFNQYPLSPSIDNAALDLLAAASRGDLNGEAGPPRRVDQPRMRSSIACVRCRRSKVKCLNQGPGTPCRACLTNNRECTYPEPLQERSHRRDGTSDRPGEAGLNTPDVSFVSTFQPTDLTVAKAPRVSRAKSKRISAHHSHLQSLRPLVDALDTTVLTPAVWMELVSAMEESMVMRI
jgi:hypothetical protein